MFVSSTGILHFVTTGSEYYHIVEREAKKNLKKLTMYKKTHKSLPSTSFSKNLDFVIVWGLVLYFRISIWFVLAANIFICLWFSF